MKVQRLLPVGLFLIASALPCLGEVPIDVSAPREAKAGETVEISVTTVPRAKAKIEAQEAGLSQAFKLTDKNTDRNGKARWEFDIPKDYKADEMPVIVTVIHDGQEEKRTQAIRVLK